MDEEAAASTSEIINPGDENQNHEEGEAEPLPVTERKTTRYLLLFDSIFIFSVFIFSVFIFLRER